MSVLTLHRRPSGDPASVRIVEDGFRWSVFLLPPAGLLARGLWGATLVWFILVSAFLVAAVTGVLAGSAALAAIFVVHLVFAIDTPEMERRRLARRGWPAVSLVGPLSAATDFGETQADARPPASVAPAPQARTDVIGLFPSGARDGDR